MALIWQHARGILEFGDRPLLAGILNVTPDSFSDGGCYTTLENAMSRAEEILRAGAQIIDIGGESTRPGAASVPEDEELRRVIPIISAIHQRWPLAVISIDTYKAKVARQAVAAGAAIINDVSGGQWDADLLPVVAAGDAGYIAMHSLDRPERMQLQPAYDDVTRTVSGFLRELGDRLERLGVARERVIYDAGLGFGKNAEHNLQLLRATATWRELGRPLMWGLSRKSFLSHILNVSLPDRLAGALAVYGRLLQHGGPQVWRVHEVEQCAQFIDMWFRLAQP
ncbi:MAG: dihydropteroate synthase [Verrucomicrobiales bacterium]|jgi:dihydropteroate synthase|nr:dihydropteroate synthase [Verrucomicrobiales bacterium]